MNNLLFSRLQAWSTRTNQPCTVFESTNGAEVQIVESVQYNKTESVVWRFLKITDSRNAKEVKYAKCGLCLAPKPPCLIAVGNTSNMLQHLQMHHKTEYLVDAANGQKVNLLQISY